MLSFLGNLSLLAMITFYAHTVRADQERVHDPWVACFLRKAPTNLEGLPANYDENVYYNILQLCSANNGAPRNVGCVCHGEHLPIHCNQRIADPNLWWANITSSGQRFPLYCRTLCSCATRDDAAVIHEHGSQMNPAWSSENGTLRASSGADSEHDASSTLSTLGHAGALNDAILRGSQNQCGGRCSQHADCHGQDRGCMCSTQSEQFLPAQAGIKYVAACISAVASNPKRNSNWPCPCNTTYVSHACCEALDGVVHEREFYKLGELLTKNDRGKGDYSTVA